MSHRVAERSASRHAAPPPPLSQPLSLRRASRARVTADRGPADRTGVLAIGANDGAAERQAQRVADRVMARVAPGPISAEPLRSWAGDKETGLKKVGFTATYINWIEQDVLAPPDASGAPAAGAALKLSPFAAVQFNPGDKHIIDANLALSFVTGTAGGAGRGGLGDLAGDLAYTYLGNTAPGALPSFKLELGGSVSRLDWWNPDSPLMWGAKVKGNVNRYFGGASVMTGAAGVGAAGIGQQRLDRIGRGVKAMVPTAVLFTGGVAF